MSCSDEIRARIALAYKPSAAFYDHPSNAFWPLAGERTVARLGLRPKGRLAISAWGSGYRDVIARMPGEQKDDLLLSVTSRVAGEGITQIQADRIFATWPARG